MSTRCNVIIKSDESTLYYYRHSDGYPEETGESLRRFVAGYKTHLRLDVGQSAGWLIVHGRDEYAESDGAAENSDFMKKLYGWKVGAYEPTDMVHGDIEYLYTIDLSKRELTAHKHNGTIQQRLIFKENF